MKDMYEKTWGWNEKKKKLELFSPLSRYLIAITPEKPIGFAHIRFEYEHNLVRIYIMEFQIEKEYQGKGLGRFLLQAIEFIGLKRGMEIIMLTVFRINTGALAFYHKMHYFPHELSPSVADPTGAYEYEVLCKSLVKKQ
ncbi:N-alpha-acetyltransferase 40 [Histomonas meleagridis]|uniref:N-alpha-acetyltransferase 40 n=1 Tax=Histomonas meleagridis TaxID=135588 RepID=UPI00355A88C6|nr:N-alpha-acetyltransferase 40 [Histomonas meleagridis]KAH0803173.1 N-alpha-acetyltransferase 40 [Histomonas meleagridis]